MWDHVCPRNDLRIFSMPCYCFELWVTGLCSLDHQSIISSHLLKPRAQGNYKDGSAKVSNPQFISHKTTLLRSVIANILTGSVSSPQDTRVYNMRDGEVMLVLYVDDILIFGPETRDHRSLNMSTAAEVRDRGLVRGVVSPWTGYESRC